MNNLMYLLEALMLATLVATCTYVTITDLKNGIIQNKVILFSAIVAANLASGGISGSGN
jgi:Flp pilus assembly protein protease CpaA